MLPVECHAFLSTHRVAGSHVNTSWTLWGCYRHTNTDLTVAYTPQYSQRRRPPAWRRGRPASSSTAIGACARIPAELLHMPPTQLRQNARQSAASRLLEHLERLAGATRRGVRRVVDNCAGGDCGDALERGADQVDAEAQTHYSAKQRYEREATVGGLAAQEGFCGSALPSGAFRWLTHAAEK